MFLCEVHTILFACVYGTLVTLPIKCFRTKKDMVCNFIETSIKTGVYIFYKKLNLQNQLHTLHTVLMYYYRIYGTYCSVYVLYNHYNGP